MSYYLLRQDAREDHWQTVFVHDVALDAPGVDHVQYFRALVDAQYAEGEVVAEYWVANVVGAVACAAPDLAATAAATGPGQEPPAAFRVGRARGELRPVPIG